MPTVPCIPARSDNGMDENGTQVAEEQFVWHAVTCIQDDLGKQVVEEVDGDQFESLCLVCSPDDSSQNKAQHDEQTTLWDHIGDIVVQFTN